MKRLIYMFSLMSILSGGVTNATGLAKGEILVFKSGSNEKADKHGVRQYRIPHITKGPNGELVISVAGRTNVGGDHGKTTSVFAVSKDNGQTWEHIRFESDYSKPTKEGAFPMCNRTNEVQVEWVPQLECYVAIYCHHYKCYTIKSKDLKVWGKPTLIPHQDNLQKTWPSPTSFHVEKDGTMCFNLITISKEKPDQRFAQTFWSKDGVTFETSGQAKVETGECNTMKMSNGKYLYIGRVRKRSLSRLMYTYDRKTKEWGEAQSMTIANFYRCCQDLLIDGENIYVSVPLGPGRANGMIYRSQDCGKTWKEYHKMPEGAGFGYSAMTMMKGGRIGVLFERVTKEGDLRDQVFAVIPAK